MHDGMLFMDTNNIQEQSTKKKGIINFSLELFWIFIYQFCSKKKYVYIVYMIKWNQIFGFNNFLRIPYACKQDIFDKTLY